MGISANQARLMTLTARQHDLELRAQSISATKMVTTMRSQSAATAYADALNAYSIAKAAGEADAESKLATAKGTYDTEIAKLSSEEKLLDMELTQINTEHNAIKTEYDAIKSLVKDNTEKSFNVFG